MPTAFAEGTRTWEQSKFDELTKGTATGVAIRNAGGLELAPAFKTLYGTPSTYIWAIAADDAGNVYAATGPRLASSGSTPGERGPIFFNRQGFQLQPRKSAPAGGTYPAPAPRGKA